MTMEPVRGRVLVVGDDVGGLDGIVTAEADGLYFAGQMAEAAGLLFSPVRGHRRDSGPITFVVAGRNFGHGHGHYYWSAIALLREAGARALFATSFPYGFTRMAINAGLPALEWRLVDAVSDGDELEVDVEAGLVENLTTGTRLNFEPPPAVVVDILRAGGIEGYAALRLASR
jgi:3-isopropylmalate dehydratase small subunit